MAREMKGSSVMNGESWRAAAEPSLYCHSVTFSIVLSG